MRKKQEVILLAAIANKLSHTQHRLLLKIGYATFFHPDYHRRLWLLTRSADLLIAKKRSRASSYEATAGRELHPALKEFAD